MRFCRIVLAGVVSFAASTQGLYATETSATIRATLAAVRAPELPREAARLIKESAGKDRVERSLEIVRAAVEVNRSASPSIVGAAARVAPDLAARFTALAAGIEPALAGGIARAAVAAAPSYAAEITAAAVKVRPAHYAQIAYEVGYAVPGQETRIVNAVIEGLPNLKAFSDSAETSLAGLIATTPQVDRAARELGMKTDDFLAAELTPAQAVAVSPEKSTSTGKMKAFAATRASAPAQKGVPRVPGAGTPGETHRAQTVVVTPGEGRSYYRPETRPGYN